MYALTTTMRGPVDTTADAIAAAILARPGRDRSCYGDEEIRAFAAATVRRTAEFGLRTAVVAGQMLHETDYLQFGGDVPCGAHNFAGLGATGGGAAGLTYASIDVGVCAVCAHHLTYIDGDVATWPAALRHYVSLDERYADVLSTGRAGRVRTIGDYTNGNWAFTKYYPDGRRMPIGSLDNGYAAAIVAAANALLASAGTGGTAMAEPTEKDIGYPVKIDYASLIGPAREIARVKWFVQHDTEGGYPGSLAVLKGPTASVHALIDTDGTLTFMVPLDRTAYTAGNDRVSEQAVQCEWVGFASKGYTEAQYLSGAAFVRWCIAQGMTGVPVKYIGKIDADGGPEPDVPGMLGHQDVPNPSVPGAWGGVSGHTDPGPLFKWDYFLGLITAAPLVPVGPKHYLVDGHDVGEGFYHLVTMLDETTRLLVLGRCLDDQHEEWLVTDNPDLASPLRKIALPVVCCHFERNAAPLIWDKGRTPPPWDVRFPLATEHVGPANDPVVDAVRKRMSA